MDERSGPLRGPWAGSGIDEVRNELEINALLDEGFRFQHSIVLPRVTAAITASSTHHEYRWAARCADLGQVVTSARWCNEYDGNGVLGG